MISGEPDKFELGDRVVVEIGGGRAREGIVTGIAGPNIRVRRLFTETWHRVHFARRIERELDAKWKLKDYSRKEAA